VRKLLGIMLIGAMVSGCATSSIPPEKQKDYAQLDAVASFGGNPLSFIVMVDQETFSCSAFRAAPEVLPGKHAVKVDVCFTNEANLLAPNCHTNFYQLDTKAGMSYKFVNESQIEVYDRFNLKKPLYNLTPSANSVFVTPEEAKQIYDERQKVLAAQMDAQNKVKAAAQLALTERRKKNVPLVRKIGARVCQERERGMIYVGYVEGLAEEKVQIRYSESHEKGSTLQARGFQPTIVWDSPMNVDICE
jgi:hypothetical protein